MIIGIPRALHCLQHYPLWRTLFEELGAQVIVSPPTNREIVSTGASIVADVTCLPVKVYAGHVAWLRDHARVDFVFVPAIRSIERGAMHCSKFQGLPDLIRATMTDCPPLLETNIDAHRYKISQDVAFYRLGRQLTWNPLQVQRAWKRASAVDAAYRARMVEEKLTYLEALTALYPDIWSAPKPAAQDPRLNVALVGHPYCLHDDYINHDILARLRALGVRVLTSEMVSPHDAQTGVHHTTGQTRWFYENWMSGAAGHYLHDPNIAGLIAVLAFTCGPDSAMVETITRRAHALQRPFMNLVLDEHGSAAGIVTRLEAFVDMLTRQEQKTCEVSKTSQVCNPPVVLREIQKPTLGFPRMGTSAIALKSLFEGIGARVELGPSLSNRTVSLGARHSPEFICTPYKYILGNMIEMLESGADTLLYMDGEELCRNSSYTQLLNDVLRDLGYKFKLVSTGIFAHGGVFALPQYLRQFMDHFSWSEVLREIHLALEKMNLLDEVERRVQAVRPRQVIWGTIDKIWEEGLARIEQARNPDVLKQIKSDLLAKIGRIEIKPGFQPVHIATTGEYYAVLEPFYNLDVERVLGQLGAHAHRTIMLGDWVKFALILDALGLHKSEVEQAAKPYLRWNVGGEGLLTIGQTVMAAKKGFDGIVELLPFTCIPEITALNVLPRISRELNIPTISFILDEQSGRAGMRTRLEAFVDLLFRRRELRGATS
ncbi:MAG: acyl-CoA dehydratase activase-related protein [Anaerolineales bacterium]|nr:acyl-CoA dehydratase activase-related protein [Anaerolineales bacterium]